MIKWLKKALRKKVMRELEFEMPEGSKIRNGMYKTVGTCVYNGMVLHRIAAERDIKCSIGDLTVVITKGTVGGWIESESNLPDDGEGAWVEDGSMVYDNAVVRGSIIKGNSTVSKYAKVTNSLVDGCSWVYYGSIVDDSVLNGVRVSGNSVIKGSDLESQSILQVWSCSEIRNCRLNTINAVVIPSADIDGNDNIVHIIERGSQDIVAYRQHHKKVMVSGIYVPNGDLSGCIYLDDLIKVDFSDASTNAWRDKIAAMIAAALPDDKVDEKNGNEKSELDTIKYRKYTIWPESDSEKDRHRIKPKKWKVKTRKTTQVVQAQEK